MNNLLQAEAASEDPKKPTPRFRLTPRPVSPSKPGRPLSGPSKTRYITELI